MTKYQRGETVVCSLTVRDTSGDLADPDTSIQVRITDGRGVVLVPFTDMTNDSTGRYHYDFGSTAAHAVGLYAIRYRTVNAGRTTIIDEYFELEA